MVPSCLHLHWMRGRVVEAKVLPCLGDLKGRWFHLSPLRDLMFNRRLGIFLHIWKHRLNFWWNHHVENAISISEKKNPIAASKSWRWPDSFSNHSTKIWNHKIATGAWRFMSPHLQQFFTEKTLWICESLAKLRAQTSARAPRPQATLRCLGEQPEPGSRAQELHVLNESLFCVGSQNLSNTFCGFDSCTRYHLVHKPVPCLLSESQSSMRIHRWKNPDARHKMPPSRPSVFNGRRLCSSSALPSQKQSNIQGLYLNPIVPVGL